MNKVERALLKEIRNTLLPLSEAVEDFTFAIIEPRAPEENSEYETLIYVYGMKRALERGSAGWGVKLDPSGKPLPCPSCGDDKHARLGELITIKINSLTNDLENAEAEVERVAGRKKQNLVGKVGLLRNDIEYLKDALDRFEETGKSEEKVLCPDCSGWEWADIKQYQNPETGNYDKKMASKYPLPWNMFMNWLWKTLKNANLNPMQQEGFASDDDIYGVNVPSAKGKEPIGAAKHVTINVESLGKTNLAVHGRFSEILDAAIKPSFLNIASFPTQEMVDEYDMAASRKGVSRQELKQAERFEEWLKDNRGFYVSSRVEESRFGEELGLPEYEVTTPLDISKLLQRLRGETVPPVSGEPPPREGEWGTYSQSIAGASAQRRSARSAKAHKTYEQTPAYYEKHIKPREEEEERKRAVAEYPGSKYKYWDDHVDRLSRMIGADDVSVELAVEKYMDSLDEFPKPFDFDGLGQDQAVRALNILKAIEPSEIDSLVAESVKYINNILTESVVPINFGVATTVIADLGSNRANMAYCTLREAKDELVSMARSPLYAENAKFNRIYKKAETALSSLLKVATPLTKIIGVVPVVEQSDVFNVYSSECWINILCERMNNTNTFVLANGRVIGEAYRGAMRKIAPWSIGPLTKLAKTADDDIASTIAASWDAIIGGRPMAKSDYLQLKEIASRHGVMELLA